MPKSRKNTKSKKARVSKAGSKTPAYNIQKGTVVYSYKSPNVKNQSFSYHKGTVASGARKIQKRIDQVLQYEEQYKKAQKLQKEAAAMGIKIELPPKQKIGYTSDPRRSAAETRALKTFIAKNSFEVGLDGRVHNTYVISQYDKAVEKSNEARQSLSSSILGKTKTSGGKSIKSGGRYERLTKSEIKALGGDLTTKLSEYNTERGLSDEKILAKAKTILKTANELSGKNSNSLFKKNYIKGLAQQVKDGVISEDDFNALKGKIKGLSTADMLEWYYREEYSQIGFIYSVDEFSQQAQSQAAQGLVTSLTKFAKKKGV